MMIIIINNIAFRFLTGLNSFTAAMTIHSRISFILKNKNNSNKIELTSNNLGVEYLKIMFYNIPSRLLNNNNVKYKLPNLARVINYIGVVIILDSTNYLLREFIPIYYPIDLSENDFNTLFYNYFGSTPLVAMIGGLLLI